MSNLSPINPPIPPGPWADAVDQIIRAIDHQGFQDSLEVIRDAYNLVIGALGAAEGIALLDALGKLLVSQMPGGLVWATVDATNKIVYHSTVNPFDANNPPVGTIRFRVAS